MPSSAIDAPILIIGYGNELRGDDAAGPVAARQLAERLSPATASVIVVHQLLPELADPISRAKLVIFIDADAQLPPGEIRRVDLSPSERAAGPVGHYQHPQGILTLAKDLFGHAPEALLFTIGGETFDRPRVLSAVVKKAVPTLTRDIMALVSTPCRLIPTVAAG